MKEKGRVDRTVVRSTLPLQAAAVALLSFWLYRSALPLAYFNDDPTGHFAWMDGRSVVAFFTVTGLPVELPEPAPRFRLLVKGAELASDEEKERNPRATPVRLRAAERVREAA